MAFKTIEQIQAEDELIIKEEEDLLEDYDLSFVRPRVEPYLNQISERLNNSDFEIVESGQTELCEWFLVNTGDNTEYVLIPETKVYKIAIVMICFNGIRTTIDTLRSFEETCPPNVILTYYLLDPGSTDQTSQILSELNSNDSFKFHVTTYEENYGVQGNRIRFFKEMGAFLSDFDYVISCDNDIVIHDGNLTKLLEIIESDSECVMVAPVCNDMEYHAGIAHIKRSNIKDESRVIRAHKHLYEGTIYETNLLYGFFMLCDPICFKAFNCIASDIYSTKWGAEDLEFCRAAKNTGGTLLLAPEVYITHKAHSSTSKFLTEDEIYEAGQQALNDLSKKYGRRISNESQVLIRRPPIRSKKDGSTFIVSIFDESNFEFIDRICDKKCFEEMIIFVKENTFSNKYNTKLEQYALDKQRSDDRIFYVGIFGKHTSMIDAYNICLYSAHFKDISILDGRQEFKDFNYDQDLEGKMLCYYVNNRLLSAAFSLDGVDLPISSLENIDMEKVKHSAQSKDLRLTNMGRTNFPNTGGEVLPVPAGGHNLAISQTLFLECNNYKALNPNLEDLSEKNLFYQFDNVFVIDVIKYMGNAYGYLKDLFKLCKSNGKCYLINSETIRPMLNEYDRLIYDSAMNNRQEMDWRDCIEGFSDPVISPLSNEQIAQLAKQIGFSVEHSDDMVVLRKPNYVCNTMEQ